MLPAYVIHSVNQPERDSLVKRIVKLTNAKVVEAVWDVKRPHCGCRASHRKVAELAKLEYPDSAYMVFENDCEIVDESFLNLDCKDFDVVYFGINGSCIHNIPVICKHTWGTHAMMITPRARDIFLRDEEKYLLMPFVHKDHPIDQLWCVIQHIEKLRVFVPDEIKKYVRQKTGLKSSISGFIRS